MKKLLLVLLVLFLAFGQTLLMYFWQDDFALIFKLMHQNEPMGSFGSGIIGEGPYKYLVTPFVPFFPLFGTYPFGYFVVGFVTLIPVIFLFYKLANELLKNKRRAYFATLIFSSGYIGSDIMFRVINSWQTNIGLMLAFISLIYFVKSARVKSFKFYVFSFAFFYAATEFVYVRSHSLVICFLVINLLFLTKLNFRNIRNFILAQIPFWFLFYLKYLKDVPAGQGGIKNFINEIGSFNFEYLAGLFGTIGNAIVPDYYQSKLISFFASNYNFVTLLIFCVIGFSLLKIIKVKTLYSIIFILVLPVLYTINKNVFSKQVYWYNDNSAFLSVSIGLYVSFIVIAVGIFLWKRNRSIAIGVISGYLFLTSQFFGYYLDYPTTLFTTTHRYLSYSAFGYALLIASLFAIFEKLNKKLYVFFVFLIVISNLILGITYQARLVKDRSVATKEFYENLVRFQPKVNKNSIFYFDLQNNGFVRGQFRDFFSVGSMPDSTALAIWYGLDRDEIHFVTDYDEFLFMLDKYKDINNIYTFYYEKNGLIDTTNQMRRALSKGGAFVGTYNEFNIKGKLNFLDLPQCVDKKADTRINSAISYLADKEEYYKSVTVKSSSEWRGQERILVVDNNLDTSWRGHRIYWHDHGKENLVLDLQKSENINKVIWVNTNNMISPTGYNILVSNNEIDWKVVKEVVDGKERKSGEVVVEEFEPVNARFIKVEFTNNISDDSPAVSEIEVVKSIYSIEDIDIAKTLLVDPIRYMDRCAFRNNFNNISRYAYVDIEFNSNKGKSIEKVKLNELSKESFKVVSNVGGTGINTIKINMHGIPLVYSIDEYQLKTLDFSQIVNRRLIKNFSRN